MKLCDVISVLDELAPPHYALPDDRIGLQIGDTGQDIRRICVAVDASRNVIDAAKTSQADLLVTRHPLIYNPIRRMVAADAVASRVMSLVRNETALYVMHTNLDCAPGGINDTLAEKLGVRNARPLSHIQYEDIYKIVVFTPEEDSDAVKSAMASSGAGALGNYTECSFQTNGVGQFRPNDQANPHIGARGALESVDETRLEMICNKGNLSGVVKSMLAAHPYEEPAYDIIHLENSGAAHGLGLIGELETPIPLNDFSGNVRKALSLECMRAVGENDKLIKTVALCGGSGGGLLSDAHRLGADAYVTGDTKHDQRIDAECLGIALIDAGHYETERPGTVRLYENICKSHEFKDISITFVD